MELLKMAACEFDEVFGIMSESFPETEFRPYESQRALLDRKEYSILCAKGESGEVKGFIALWRFERFAYIEHFAVSSDSRNEGLGTRMLASLLASVKQPVCLEVELPVGEMERRRIGFYERNGFILCEREYVQPPMSAGKPSVPLRLMSSVALSDGEFEYMKDLLYAEVYGIAS